MAAVDLNLNPEPRALRNFGFIARGVFGFLGGWLLWRNTLLGFELGSAALPTAVALWGLGGLSALLSLVAPRANRPLWVALALITYPIGFVLSYVLMGLVFYGMLLPVNLVFRAMGRDAMERRFDPDADSYWVERGEPSPPKRYFRQF
jgi:apolipoprotein N-acyltransferase